MPYASLDQLKKHLNMKKSDDDDELALHLAAANELLDGYCGLSEPTEVTQRVGRGVISLSSRPVREVISITPYQGTPVDLAGVTLTDAGALEGYRAGHGVTTVVYSAGRDTVPPTLTLACLLIAAHSWMTQRGPAGARLPGYDNDDVVVVGSSYLVPNRAWEYMQPHILVTVA